MSRTVQTMFKSAMPVVALGALMLFGPAAAMAQRGGGHGGHFGGGARSYSAPSARGYSGAGRGYAAPNVGRSYAAPNVGRAYGYGGGGGYAAGRFYSGRGYYYGGRFWARPYFGVGIGIPFGYGYGTGYGCGYYDGYGNYVPAPCYAYGY